MLSPSTPTPDVSIVTVSFNSRDVLRRCIEAARAEHGRLHIEHWVVDNASTDGSVAMVQDLFPDVHVLSAAENLGPGRARNLAIPRCAGRHVLNLDSDVIVQRGTIEALVGYMDANPDVGVAGCKLLNADGSHQRSAFHLLQPGQAARRRLRSLVKGRRDDFSTAAGPVPVGWLKGAICIYRRRALDQVGLFDPRFFLYSDEVDLHLRMHELGWKVCYLPTVSATHLWGLGVSQNFAECELHRYYATILIARNHQPYWWYVWTRLSVFARALYFSRFCTAESVSRSFGNRDADLLRMLWRSVLRVSLDRSLAFPDTTRLRESDLAHGKADTTVEPPLLPQEALDRV